MNKVFFTPIGGKFYPLAFTWGAKVQIINDKVLMSNLIELKRNNLDKEAVSKLPLEQQIEYTSNNLDLCLDLAIILIEQGCAYLNRFEPGRRIREKDARDENGIWKPLNKDDLLLSIENNEISKLASSIVKCDNSKKGEISVSYNDPESKKKQQVKR